MLGVRLPKEIEERLATLAKQTGRTMSFYAREAILAHLEDMEDAYLAEKRLEDFVKSGEKAIPLEDVRHGLGLAD